MNIRGFARQDKGKYRPSLKSHRVDSFNRTQRAARIISRRQQAKSLVTRY